MRTIQEERGPSWAAPRGVTRRKKLWKQYRCECWKHILPILLAPFLPPPTPTSPANIFFSFCFPSVEQRPGENNGADCGNAKTRSIFDQRWHYFPHSNWIWFKRRTKQLNWNIKWREGINYPFSFPQELKACVFSFILFFLIRASISANKLLLGSPDRHEKQCRTEVAFHVKYGAWENVCSPKVYSGTNCQLHRFT